MNLHHEFFSAPRIQPWFDDRLAQIAQHRAEALALHRQQQRERRSQIRFRRLYWLRSLLFRFTPGLARRLTW